MTDNDTGVVIEQELEVDGRLLRLTVYKTSDHATYSVVAMENVEGPLHQYAMAMDASALWRLRHMIDNALCSL